MRRVLLDENMDRRLKRLFDPELGVFTVMEMGWSGLKNGRLLSQASKEFDVFVTMDGNIPYQQNLKSLTLGIVLIKARSNRRDALKPMMDKVNEAAKEVTAGTLIVVQ